MIHIGYQLRWFVLRAAARVVALAVVPGALVLAGAVWLVQRREALARGAR